MPTGSPPQRSAPRPVRALALAALALAAAPARAAAGGAPGMFPLPVEVLRGRIDEATPHAFGPAGLELHVDATTSVVLPGFAQVVELDLTTAGVVGLTWASRTQGREFSPFGPPWRHLTLPQGRTTVSLDFRTTQGWTTTSEPYLGLTGAGVVTLHAIRALPPVRLPAQLDAYDRALLWAPEAIGHTTINLLTTPYWRATRDVPLTAAVALVAAAAFAVALLVGLALGRRPRVSVALAAAAVVAAGLFDAHLLVRFLPAFDLRPTPDPEVRIRENYWVAPDVGAMAALARATLAPAARVGVVARERDWFAGQTLCFNLAPRPCAILHPNETVHRGIAGIGSLTPPELDAIVVFRADWTPPGFERVAGIGPSRWIGRRR